jgi:serine/threonine-protein kinase HipA
LTKGARKGRQPLAVWLHGICVATLTEPSPFRYRLEFTDDALDAFGEGARVLSLSLPISDTPLEDHRTNVRQRPVSAFLEGLLPEGNLRTVVATELGVPTMEKMALLRQVGGECAGAVQFLPIGATPGAGTVRPLTTEQVDRLVADLPTYHSPEGTAPQASLAGIQDKVLLTDLGAEGWGLPEDGAASSHLIKPEPLGTQVLDHLIQVEDWAMKVAATTGLSAASTRIESFDGRRAIVVTRYDRDAGGRRTHQEDFCQALALDPTAKYESLIEAQSRGSRLRRIVARAAPRSLDPDAFRTSLLEMVTFNVVIGNGDAHSKNYSLLLGGHGEVSLAPLYDCAPVRFLAPRFKNTGHVIAGISSIDWIGLDDLAEEATSWGMSATRARRVVDDTCERTWHAAHAVPLPEDTDFVLDELEALWSRRSWRPR